MIPAVRPNDYHARAFTRALRARNLSPRTVQSYLEAVETLREHAADRDLADLDRPDLQDFLADQLARHSPNTAAIRYRSLQQFYKWATEEDIVPVSPLAGMSPPVVPEKPVTVLTIDQIKALLAAAGGKSLEDRRDNAIIRLFLEPGGPRLAELVGLQVGALDLDSDVVTVLGKGRRERGIPFGSKTGQALDRYVRLRALHPRQGLPHLWLGKKGPLTNSGVQQMLRRRAAKVGLPVLYPHMLRHTAAHEWLDNGGNETDAMRLFGWRSRQMLERYGASVAVQRAQDSARRLQLGDRY
jgi:integrase/recombinase XerC